MKLIEITEQEPWDAFQLSQPYAQFLQSWTWGEFRASQGCLIRRFALCDAAGSLVTAIQMEYRRRRFGMGYWFAPRGPVFSSALPFEDRREVFRQLCEELLQVGELRRHTLFWRMEPVSELSQPEGLMPLSFERTHALNPAVTMLLDLSRSEDELLRRMHEKTRYHIRVAERLGVTVRRVDRGQVTGDRLQGTGDRDVDVFLKLMNETATRDHFVQHPLTYLAATYQFLGTRGMATLRIAERNGKGLAANLEIAFGDTVTYLYGASSSDERSANAPTLLQWSAIRDANARGFSLYDLWGVNPEWRGMFYFKPSWEGITRWKRGYGGRLAQFVGTWDLPFSGFAYRLTHLGQFFHGYTHLDSFFKEKV